MEFFFQFRNNFFSNNWGMRRDALYRWNWDITRSTSVERNWLWHQRKKFPAWHNHAINYWWCYAAFGNIFVKKMLLFVSEKQFHNPRNKFFEIFHFFAGGQVPTVGLFLHPQLQVPVSDQMVFATQPFGPVTPIQQIEQVNPIQQFEPSTPTHQFESVTPTHQFESATPTQQIGSVTPTQQIGPSTPTQPMTVLPQSGAMVTQPLPQSQPAFAATSFQQPVTTTGDATSTNVSNGTKQQSSNSDVAALSTVWHVRLMLFQLLLNHLQKVMLLQDSLWS